MIRKHNMVPAAVLLICTALLPTNGTTQQGIQALPEMGDSSATILSRQEELRIGSEMMQQLDRSGMVVSDPIVNEYIQGLGRSLASAAVSRDNHFQFFVVDAPSINAFAMPGGFIGAHSGLILASTSESELAAVLAHEIAHVTQHHIARSVEKASQMNLPITAAVIAAILLGGGDPQVAQAALAASLGGSSQMQLDFTRSNEREADRIGMQLLSVSDFDPRGMAGFFGRLQEETRYYGKGVPEFLRTHPVNASRIAEAEDRARQYPQQHHRQNSIHYHLVKARLQYLSTDSAEKLLQQLPHQQASSAAEREAQQYLTGLLYKRLGKTKEARTLLGTLYKGHPERIAYIYELAKLEEQVGNSQAATRLYRQGLKQYPGNPLLTLAHANTLMEAGEYEPSKTLLEELLRTQPQNREAHRLLAELESKAGNPVASNLARAEYYYLGGEYHSAIDQLHQAQRTTPLPHYYATRIEARLEQIKAKLELQGQPAQ